LKTHYLKSCCTKTCLYKQYLVTDRLHGDPKQTVIGKSVGLQRAGQKQDKKLSKCAQKSKHFLQIREIEYRDLSVSEATVYI